MTVMRVSPWVTHERLDDDVIAINLETGTYYALDGAAADCWSVAVRGAALDELVEVLVSRYEVTAERARHDADVFVTALREERLLVDAESVDPSVPGDLPAAGAAKRPYTAPSLQRYDDLEDLLLLDPIHEVDDVGWPVARGE